MVEPNCSHDISTPKAFFFFFWLFRICCWVHSVVTLPITKSQYSFIGRCGLQQTSGPGWRFRTTDSSGTVFSRVITDEPAEHTLFTTLLSLLPVALRSCGRHFLCMKSIKPIIPQREIISHC